MTSITNSLITLATYCTRDQPSILQHLHAQAMEEHWSASLQHRKKHPSDGFVSGSPPRTTPRGKRRDSRSNLSHVFTDDGAGTSLEDHEHSDFIPQVRNHRRTSAVRIEVNEHLRRRSLPEDSAQGESSLFQGRLEAFLETCVELIVHDQIANTVLKHVGNMLEDSITQIEARRHDLARLEEDLETLRACWRDLETEKARMVQRTTGGSISDLACSEERDSDCWILPSAQPPRISKPRTRSDNYRAAQDCPVQCAAISVISALSSVFYRQPPSAFNGPPESPMDDTTIISPFESVSAPLDPFRFTDGISTSHRSHHASGDSLSARKLQLMQRPLGEHLFLPGVQIDECATIEQALADARFMNQLLPSDAMEQRDSFRMIARLMRLIADVEVDIRALRQESKLVLSDLEHKVLRMSTYRSGKLRKSLKGFESRLHERQNAAWIGLIETASLEAGCSPTSALQSTLCPANLRGVAGVAQPAAYKEEVKRLQRPSVHRKYSGSSMAVSNLESMSP